MSEAPIPLPLTDSLASALPADSTVVLPVIEERAVVRVERVQSGRVRLQRTVREEPEVLQIPLQHDQVRVERVPVGRVLEPGTEPPAPRYEGDTYIVPVLREEAVVVTRLVLVEELRITHEQHHTTHTEILRLRRETITVERLPGDPKAPSIPGPIEPVG